MYKSTRSAYYAQERFRPFTGKTDARKLRLPCTINPGHVPRAALSCSVLTCERLPLVFSVSPHFFAGSLHKSRDLTRNKQKCGRIKHLFVSYFAPKKTFSLCSYPSQNGHANAPKCSLDLWQHKTLTSSACSIPFRRTIHSRQCTMPFERATSTCCTPF